MTKGTNNSDWQQLPALPTFDELRDREKNEQFLKSYDWQNVDVSADWLDFSIPYTRPNFLLSCDGRPFMRINDVQVISGQAGHGKSMLISQIITAVLKGEFGCLKYELADTISKPTVLLIDTEQSQDDVIAGKNRICDLCGWGLQEDREDFKIIMLRSTETALERWQKTLKAIYEVKPTLIVLDGLIDVVQDFNDQKECAEMIFSCMQIASHYGAAMLCVLHQNPLSTKLVGHLGSAAIRKVTDVLVITKDKSKGDIIFKVSEIKARGHQDIEDWKFRVLPVSSWGRPEQITETPTEAPTGSLRSIEIEEIEQCLADSKNELQWPLYATDIKNIFRQHGIKGNDLLQECITRAKNRRFITEQPKSEWEAGQKYPKFNLTI